MYYTSRLRIIFVYHAVYLVYHVGLSEHLHIDTYIHIAMIARFRRVRGSEFEILNGICRNVRTSWRERLRDHTALKVSCLH